MTEKKHKILIVDDLTENIQVLGTLLSKYGYHTGFATNGKEALERAKSGEYDLILLDIMMPEMDGYEVLEVLRSRSETKDVPIIFVTAKTEEEDIVKGLKLGAQDYITKPFNSHELRSRIDTHIELHKARQQLESVNETLQRKVKERTIELEKANAELYKLEEAKSYFLALLAHELNTPLSIILGTTDRIDKYTSNNKIIDLCTTIRDAGKRLQKFSDISQLITKLKTKQYNINFVEYPVADILNTVIINQEEQIKAKKLKISKNINDDDAVLGFDPVLIQEVFSIIMENSVKFADENTEIIINGKTSGKHFLFEFIDHGPGFSEEALSNIFKEFVSGDIMHHKEGTGLGLVAAKLILEAHNGHIKVENQKDKGARITISLPTGSD